MATATEFTVISGKALDFAIVVKQNGSIAPLILDPSDRFTFSIMNKRTDEKYIDSKPMVITDPTGGEVTGHITNVESALLPVKKAAAEDGFISRPNLRLVVHGQTLNQGEMTAIIEEVYVVNG